MAYIVNVRHAASSLASRFGLMSRKGESVTDITKALSDLASCLSDLADCVSDLDAVVGRIKNR